MPILGIVAVISLVAMYILSKAKYEHNMVLFGIIIFFLMLFIAPVFIDQIINDLDGILSYDGQYWIDFWGSVLGVFISGVFMILVMIGTNKVNTKNNEETLREMRLQREIDIKPEIVLQPQSERFRLENLNDRCGYDNYLEENSFKLSLENVGHGIARNVSFTIVDCEEVLNELKNIEYWEVQKSYRNEQGEIIEEDANEEYITYRYLNEFRPYSNEDNRKDFLLIKSFERQEIKITDAERYLKKYLINSIADSEKNMDISFLRGCVSKEIGYKIIITYNDVLGKKYRLEEEYIVRITSMYNEETNKKVLACEFLMK